MRAPIRTRTAFVLAAALLAPGPGAAGSGFPSDAVLVDPTRSEVAPLEYLVVTSEALAPAFVPLVQEKTSRGVPAAIVAVEAVLAAYGGADDPERLRAFLRHAHRHWGIRYLLLGGDAEVIPPRFVDNGLTGPQADVNPCDLYYAGLDGSWDADGDGAFGEWPEDEPDLVAELAIGRAPVTAIAGAEAFVAKTLAFGAEARRTAGGVALLCEDGEPCPPGCFDYATYGQDIFASVLEGTPAGAKTVRLFESSEGHPGSLPLDRAAALDALGSGAYRLVAHVGFANGELLSAGDPTGAEVVTVADVDALANAPDFHVFSSHFTTARFHEDTILEHLVRNPAGGAVAGMGQSGLMFPVPAQNLVKLFFEETWVAGRGTLGEAIRTARDRSLAGPTSWMPAMFWTLLGDPELPLGPGLPPRASRPDARGDRLVRAVPNPFRSTTRLEIPRADRRGLAVDVLDVAGRRIRTLRAPAGAGGAAGIRWDGRDGRGRAVAPGVYFVKPRGGDVAGRVVRRP